MLVVPSACNSSHKWLVAAGAAAQPQQGEGKQVSEGAGAGGPGAKKWAVTAEALLAGWEMVAVDSLPGWQMVAEVAWKPKWTAQRPCRRAGEVTAPPPARRPPPPRCRCCG